MGYEFPVEVSKVGNAVTVNTYNVVNEVPVDMDESKVGNEVPVDERKVGNEVHG